MGLLGTLRDAFAASTQTTNRTEGTDDSEGAFWCHDCQERIRDTEVSGEGSPSCPSCGEEMEFERSKGTSSCAC